MISVKRDAIIGATHRKRSSVARELGIHANTLQLKIEGKSDWSLRELNKLEEVLEIPMTQFIKCEDLERQSGAD